MPALGQNQAMGGGMCHSGTAPPRLSTCKVGTSD